MRTELVVIVLALVALSAYITFHSDANVPTPADVKPAMTLGAPGAKVSGAAGAITLGVILIGVLVAVVYRATKRRPHYGLSWNSLS